MPSLTGLLIGLVAGTFGGLVGLGGGVLMVPLATGWARLKQHVAHGTSLVAVVFTGLAGTWTYASGDAVDWRAVLFLALTSTLFTFTAASLSNRVSATSLRRLFGLLLVVTGVLLPLKGFIPAAGFDAGGAEIAFLLLTGALVGSLSGLLGIGGGSVIVPLLVFALGFDQHTAQGTSLAAMIPAGVSGAFVHWRLGHVDKGVVGLVVGVMVGAWLGGTAALALPSSVLRVIFAIILVLTGLRYLRRSAVKAGP